MRRSQPSVSTSTAALVAGAVLAGPVGALVVGVAVAATAMMKHHSPISRFVYNGSTHLMAGLGCVWVVQLVGLSPSLEPMWLLFGACHDIGKLAIPDSILAKCGPLTELEYDQVKEHPSVGARIFVESRFLHNLLRVVRHHHEWYDGGGYPTGLKGESIPLEALILSVADAVEAIASDRADRPSSPPEMVLHELRAGAGTQFDPEVVEALCRAVEGGSCEIVNSSAEVRGHLDGYRVTSGEKRPEAEGAPQEAEKLPSALLQQG